MDMHGNGDFPNFDDIKPKPDQEQPWRAIHLPSLEGVPVPDRRWIVPHWLPVRVVTLFYADGGIGKTLLTLQLMATTALHTGRWCGIQVEPVKSIGLFSEDDLDEIHIRMEAIRQLYGASWSDLRNMCPVDAVGQDNILVRFTSYDGKMSFTPRYTQLREQALDTKSRLVVIDTAATCFGGNENDRSQVTQFIGALTRLAGEIDGAVLLNAHPSRSGLSTGNLDGASTAWNNSCRSRWTLMRPEDQDGKPILDSPQRTLTRRKANMASTGDEITMEWRDGVFVVPEQFGAAATGHRKDQAEAAFLLALDARKRIGLHVSAKERAGNFAPKILSNTPEARDFSKRELTEAMGNLLKRGCLRTKIYKHNYETHEELVRADK
jgi:RecA-family ATPase